MTALALYTQDLGCKVTGSDVWEDFVTSRVLAKRRIPITVGFSPRLIRKETKLLIYSAARPHNPQIAAAQEKEIKVLSYAQALGEFLKGKQTIAVCGVGGKTTTTAMISWILEKCGQNPSYVAGVGEINNLGFPGRWTKGEIAVVEADDYVSVPGIDNTPKFMYLDPKIIVITNIEHDHPDVYQDLNKTIEAFLAFLNKLPKDGLIVANIDSQNIRQTLNKLKAIRPQLKILTYGSTNTADWFVSDVTFKNQRTKFQLKINNQRFNLTLKIPGRFNVLNATAAVVVAANLKLNLAKTIQALGEFSSTKRRFEKIGEFNDIEVWDDYAHHPLQIQETLKAARSWFEKKRLIVVFQPHTYSRTKVLLDDFAQSFSAADKVIITDIFSSAREKTDPTISGKILAEKISHFHKDVTYLASTGMLKYLKTNLNAGDVILTLGAGDIYKLAEKLIDK